MGFSDQPSNQIEEGHDTSAKSHGKAGLVLGAIAVVLVLILGGGLVWSVVRLNRQMAQLSQQTERRSRRVVGTERLQQVLGQIAETHRTTLGLVMTLGEKSIRFEFAKADIEPQYRDILNRIAGVLMTLQGYSIYVYGYTDDIGTQEYNLGLSGRRAQAVRDSLVQAGINP